MQKLLAIVNLTLTRTLEEAQSMEIAVKTPKNCKEAHLGKFPSLETLCIMLRHTRSLAIGVAESILTMSTRNSVPSQCKIGHIALHRPSLVR